MMNKEPIRSVAKIEGRVVLYLTEEEARALDAIVGYGPEVFVKWFYKNLGSHYLKPHEMAMRSFFDTARRELPRHLKKFDEARQVFEGKRESKMKTP